MPRYIYKGPVMEFNTLLADIWEGETVAPYFERRNIMEDLIEKIGAMLLILLMIAAGVLTVGAVCFIFSLFLPL